MKRSQRIASLLLVGVLLLAILPGNAWAAGKFGEVGKDPSEFPEVFDLRDVDGVSYVTPVKSQGQFGTCWGFAAIASAETSILTSGLAEEMGYTAETLDLSEKHLAYFLWCPVDEEDDPQYGEGLWYLLYEGEEDRLSTKLNQGGIFVLATNLFAAGTGPVLEDADSQFLYRGKGGKIYYVEDGQGGKSPYCYDPDDDWTIDADLRWKQNFVLKESYIVDVVNYSGEENEAAWRASVNEVKDLLYSGHAVEIGFYADNSMPGEEAVTEYMSKNWAHYTYDDPGANHGVTIVGWDDHYPRENFAHKTTDWTWDWATEEWVGEVIDAPIPDHDGAWLVKNSWGSELEEFPNGGNWGLLEGQDKGVYNEETGKYEYEPIEGAKHTGYFWLSYEDKTMGCAEALDFDLVTALEGYYIAEYDYMPVFSTYVETYGDKVQMANLFTVDADVPSARLDYVSCQTGAANAKVTYDVYLLEEGDVAPTDGKRVSGATAQYRYGGFHKIKLDTPVTLRSGQRFAVVVTQELEQDGQTRYAINVQGTSSKYNAETTGERGYAVGIVNPGESAFLLDGKWTDLSATLAQSALLRESLDPERRKAVLDNFPIKAYLAVEEAGAVAGFNDVPQGAYYADAVRWAVEAGLVGREGESGFAPKEACTRAQMVEFLWRAAGSPASAGTVPFPDVKESDSCYQALAWAVEKGIVKGTPQGTFQPQAAVDRSQMAALLYRYEQSRGGGFTGMWAFRLNYSDVADLPEWAYESFCWLTMHQIVNGFDGKLMPRAECSRSETVTMLYRYFSK